MNKKNTGFTLIEILVVLGIIALLTTMAMVAVRYARERARIAKAQNEVDQILLAVSMLANDTGQWPGHQTANRVNAAAGNEVCDSADLDGNGCTVQLSEGAAGLMLDDGANPYSSWAGPYMPDIPDDPWGYEYFLDTDYEIDIDNQPCGCGGCICGTNCIMAAVVGSYGPDGLAHPSVQGANSCDDIIKIITK